MLMLAAISAAVSLAVSAFWAAVRSFVLAAAAKIKQILMGAAEEAVSLIMRKSIDGTKQLAYNYIRDGGSQVISRNLFAKRLR